MIEFNIKVIFIINIKLIMKIFIIFLTFIALSFSCVKRADVIARGLEWVKAHVPYSQTSTHEGYRTDCSGFASMAWQLARPGLTTGQFVPSKVCSQTTKANLKEGDLILAPNHHVVVFHEWVDSAKTTYWGM
jgi:hypothetical protein